MSFYYSAQEDVGFTISFYNDPRSQFWAFAKGYRQAADMISHALLEKGNFRDYEAYPMVFLYRHALELNMKNIIYKAAKLAHFREINEVDVKLYNCHDLVELSKKTTEIMGMIFGQNDLDLSNALKLMSETSKEFSSIDRFSYAFRYPIDKEGNYSTERGLQLSVAAIANNMSSLLKQLETIDFGLDIETDIAEELYRALRDL